MRNFWIFLLALVLLTWEVGGALWLEKKYCCPNPVFSDAPPRKIEVSARSEPRLKNLNIYYAQGSCRFLPSSFLSVYFAHLKTYLNKNPEKKAYIRSFTDDKEPNGEWVGVCRAAALESFLIASGFRKEQILIPDLAVAERGNPAGHLKQYRVEVRITE